MRSLLLSLFCMITSATLTAGSQYHSCCDQRTTVYADFLWWTAQGDQLDYGIYTEGTRVDGNPDVETLKENWLEFKPDWSPGFRVGFETSICNSNVCLFGEWTSYKTDNSNTTNLTKPDSDDAILTFGSDFIGGAGTNITEFETATISSDFYFQINRLDLGFCKSCCICDGLRLKPYAAFTYAHIKENLKLLAKFDNTEEGAYFKTDDYKTDTSYCGYGAKLGLTADWNIFDCFSIFTEGSLTGLWGSYELNNKFLVNQGGSINPIEYNNSFSFDDCRGRVISQIQLGIKYETCFCNQYPFLVQIGWEHQVLFDQTDWLVRGSQLATEGSKPAANLVLQGLVVRAGFGF